ncbi:response regulator [Chryseobacterium sp. KACC 21268]|nr:response regulator [Chryseobacterium sp. KACC 21268]
MRKIILVEDDQAIREFLVIFLESENYTVRSFSTVNEFLNRDQNDLPDLYLFDVMLPDGSGIDLCKEIKRSDNNNGIPVIIMSAHAQLSQLEDFCDPKHFIAKPFDIDVVLNRIKVAIKK